MQVDLAEIAILSLYLASLRAVNRSSDKCSTISCDELCRVYNTSPVAGKRRSLLMAGKNDEMYDNKPQRYAEDNVMQW